jgi:thiol-disulfide isomerase/thioredoxin
MKKSVLNLLLFLSFTAQAQPAVIKINDLMHRLRHHDTTYVVNFWATWCKPCVKELPSLDSLHRQHLGNAVRVLLVSVDFADDLQKRLVPFLNKNKIAATCVLLDEINGNDYINRINPKWSGAIPATLVRKGDKFVFAEKPLVMAELEQMVEDARKP